MKTSERIKRDADSLADLLAAQCSDLEALLGLARAEADAAGRGDFDEVMRVVAERATIGERLEVYHRQTAELRSRLQDASDAAAPGGLAQQAERHAIEIQMLDGKTAKLLQAAKDGAAQEIMRLDTSRRNASAYLRDGRRAAVACDKRV